MGDTKPINGALPMGPGRWVNLSQQEAPGQNKTVTLYVNTRPKSWTGKSINYDEVVRLAYENPPTGENIVITVTYRKGEDKKPEGSLTKDQSVHVKDGMIFNVTATDRS